MSYKTIALVSLLLPLGMSSLAHAEEKACCKSLSSENSLGFVEIGGAYGFQLGSSPFLPDASQTDYKHPLTNGYSAGLTAGIKIATGLHVMANYDYTSASSRGGSVDKALDKVSAEISFHTIAVGMRSSRRLGPGNVYAELGLGVLLPLETKVTYDYPTGFPVAFGTIVTGYKTGYGAQAALGYQFSIGERFYVGTGLKMKAFATSNEGMTQKTTDVLTATGPVSGTVNIESSGVDGVKTISPSAYSVQDIRLQLSVGTRF